MYGKPVITMPKKRNQRGVFLCEVGSDTVKEMLYARFALPVVSASEAAPYTFRFPDNPDIFSEEEARQIVAEELVEKVVNGRVKLLWDKKRATQRSPRLPGICLCCPAYFSTTMATGP